ncbi:MAG: asparagine synthase-related protein, partial [Polyangiaceae bacterium]
RGPLAMPAEIRAAMLAPCRGDDRVIEGEHFWMTGSIRERSVESAAAVGFVARRPLLGDDPPEGNYALARVDAGGRLVLTRSVSGGERLYYTVHEQTVLCSSSLRPLLAHPAMSREVHVPTLKDVLLSGHPVFGDRTPLSAIHEVKPGHDAHFGAGLIGSQRGTTDDFRRSPEGDLRTLARNFRQTLARAVELAIGDERPVAIALSGGIDSSAIAAAAAEVVETRHIRAYSWEFDDPTHPVETPYAKMVSTRLGIAHHDVFSIDAPSFLGAIPEHLWRSESAVHWPKAFLTVAARQLLARGHRRYLTGFGIGSHMMYLRELYRALRLLPTARWLPPLWRQVRFGRTAWPHHLERLHPGLEPPHPRLYAMLAEVLCHEGLIDDHRAMFPPELHPLLPPHPRTTDAGGRSLAERLQRQAFSHLVSCIDVTRSEKAAREIGIHRIAPAHFRMCIPYAYFPIEPPRPAWSADRRHRPGKLLLKHAYRGILPDEVLFRVKDWADAVVSPNWRRRARVHMLRAVPHYPGDLARHDPRLPDLVEWWEPRSIQANVLSHRLWLEMFATHPPRPEPPTWAQLWHVPDNEIVNHEKFVPLPR